MGILRRFKDIMGANVNGLVDKCEKPDKMIDQYLRNLEADLGKVKSEAANVIALQKATEKRAANARAEVEELRAYSEAALKAGNETDARTFMMRQMEAEERAAGLEKAAIAAAEDSAKMRQMHDKLTNDMLDLRSQRDSLQARYSVAKTKQQMAGISEGLSSSADRNIQGFGRMRDRIAFELDKAEAAAEMDEAPGDELSEAKQRYDVPKRDDKVEARLAQMRDELGLQKNAG